MIKATDFRQPTRASIKINPSMIARIERQLDKQIRKASGKTPNVTLSISRGWTRLEVEATLDKYRAAGWDAQIVQDDRIGDYVSLIVKAASPQPITLNGQQPAQPLQS